MMLTRLQSTIPRWPSIWFYALILAVLLFFYGRPVFAEIPTSNRPLSLDLPATSSNSGNPSLLDPQSWTSPEGLSSALKIALLLTVLSLAPAIILMTTSFIRVIVVLSLLRQALGTQNLPPSQVITGLSLFITLFIMAPVWREVYHQAIVPYQQRQISLEEAWERGQKPIRRFMSLQIERCDNAEDVWLFLRYAQLEKEPETYDDVPLQILVPAFMLSELKTAFLIGFQIFLPFLIIDMVVSTVMVSMGMLMMPPVLVSLPFKLLLFVLLDGWHLVVGMLMESFQSIP
ncbi:flagellar type III secretion system pore protein FliP [Thermogutta sp.]|uniref:flagellar type III secretion system pore protein FliP n=1 Tax=Thermogutta sp. TaxID=1962930 RepID=UPI0032209BEE